MELGRRIYAYRTKRNLSQGDLADALGVSRQSVSKWETSNATPDLDKLVKLSELFGITLDELVGRQNAGTPSSSEPPPCAKSPARITVQQIIGVVLLCTGLAFLIFSLSGTHGAVAVTQLALSISWILCGAICLNSKNTRDFSVHCYCTCSRGSPLVSCPQTISGWTLPEFFSFLRSFGAFCWGCTDTGSAKKEKCCTHASRNICFCQR